MSPNLHSVAEYFHVLLVTIQRLVAQAQAEGKAVPDQVTLARMKTKEVIMTETGPFVRSSMLEHYQQPFWGRATAEIMSLLKAEPAYQSFVDELLLLAAAGPGIPIDHALHLIVAKVLAGENTDESVILDQLTASAFGKPQLLRSDIDVLGLAIKTPAFEVPLGESRVIFRQLTVADFEEEFHAWLPNDRTRFLPPPDSMMRIEMMAVGSMALQECEEKVLALLRLARICRISYGQRKYMTCGPFPFSGRESLGTINNIGQQLRLGIPTQLSTEAAGPLTRFFAKVGPEISKLKGPKIIVPLTIAYERYCEALFASQPERRIAICVMGLEALYFGEDETAELAYRLALRVSKVISKIGPRAEEVQLVMKAAYHIRSVFVHGSYLSEKDRLKYEKKTNMTLPVLADLLLDYLRMTIVLLLRTGQNKAAFLALIEASLVERVSDDSLADVVSRERDILILEF